MKLTIDHILIDATQHVYDHYDRIIQGKTKHPLNNPIVGYIGPITDALHQANAEQMYLDAYSTAKIAIESIEDLRQRENTIDSPLVKEGVTYIHRIVANLIKELNDQISLLANVAETNALAQEREYDIKNKTESKSDQYDSIMKYAANDIIVARKKLDQLLDAEKVIQTILVDHLAKL